ncbi:MAG: hypothetical protein ACLFTV_10890 [Desulfococcaceae bacterium]
MKCPSCGFNQKVKEGLICNQCKYRFALNPKEPPGLSDGAMAGVVRRLSGPDGLYFTMDQLRLGVWRVLAKKAKLPGCLGPFFAVFIAVPLSGAAEMLGLPVFLAFILAALIAFGLIRKFNRRSPKIPREAMERAIQNYLAAHPSEHLVDGRRLSGLTQAKVDDELIQYAPERILIVQHDDIADMLALNRFHFDHKTLVVSAQKYPEAAFMAARKFLLAHPDLPVLVAHDASEEGLRVKTRLRKDAAWNLAERPIADLGIHPKDIQKLARPVWLPELKADPSSTAKIPVGGDPFERIKKGYRLPLASAPPRSMIGALSAAAVAGLALLTPELAERIEASGDVSYGVGYG